MGLSQAATGRLKGDAVGFLTSQAANGSLAALLPAIESALLNNAAGQKEAVWDWLKTQPENEAAKLLRREVLDYAGYRDPALALQMLADVPRTAEGDALVQSLAKSLFNGGHALNRFDKVYEQAPERLRQPLIDAAFHFLVADNLDDPHAWIARVSKMPEGSRANGMERIARAWAQQMPEEAVAWAESLPSGEVRNGAAAAIAASWAAKDPQGAAEWVTSMPAGPERDRSAGSLVTALARRF